MPALWREQVTYETTNNGVRWRLVDGRDEYAVNEHEYGTNWYQLPDEDVPDVVVVALAMAGDVR